MIKLVDNDLPFQYYVKGTLLSVYAVSCRAVARTLIGEGGGIYSYIRVLSDGFLLKSIVFMVCKHEYMNIHPPPPKLSCLATALVSRMRRSMHPQFLVINAVFQVGKCVIILV